MSFENTGEIVASRMLQLIDAAGNKRPVSVFIGRPEPTSSGYSCACQIIGIGSQETCVGRGHDSIQALKNALVLAGTSLRDLNAELGGQLVWEGGPPGEFGLP